MKHFFTFSLLLILAILFTHCSNYIPALLPDLSGKPDGVYRGESSNSWVTIVLDVSLQDKRVVKIDIVKNTSSPIGKQAEKIIPQIIKRQTLDVDVVSGATGSSKTILKAVENALR
jgi:uncharacterized protein with FMN-binding domain